MNSYLEGVVPVEVYRAKNDELEADRIAFERRLAGLSDGGIDKTAKVEALVATAAGARYAFEEASIEGKRQVLSDVILDAELRDGHVAAYQLRRPFGALQMDSSEAFHQSWWAILDDLRTA